MALMVPLYEQRSTNEQSWPEAFQALNLGKSDMNSLKSRLPCKGRDLPVQFNPFPSLNVPLGHANKEIK